MCSLSKYSSSSCQARVLGGRCPHPCATWRWGFGGRKRKGVESSFQSCTAFKHSPAHPVPSPTCPRPQPESSLVTHVPWGTQVPAERPSARITEVEDREVHRAQAERAPGSALLLLLVPGRSPKRHPLPHLLAPVVPTSAGPRRCSRCWQVS